MNMIKVKICFKSQDINPMKCDVMMLIFRVRNPLILLPWPAGI